MRGRFEPNTWNDGRAPHAEFGRIIVCSSRILLLHVVVVIRAIPDEGMKDAAGRSTFTVLSNSSFIVINFYVGL